MNRDSRVRVPPRIFPHNAPLPQRIPQERNLRRRWGRAAAALRYAAQGSGSAPRLAPRWVPETGSPPLRSTAPDLHRG
ncbi:MAG TPA: hypothetical protein VEQ83_01015, partial [Lapillicoccus sp.]|nr:hypothetical protein [Lapillicoccus sp.]